MIFNYDNISTPWLGSYGEVPFHLNYSDRSMSGTVLEIDAAVSRTIRLSTPGGETVIPLDDVTGITGEMFSAVPAVHFQESVH